MPRATPLLLLLLAASARAADVFVIADSANQTRALAAAAHESIADANERTLTAAHDTQVLARDIDTPSATGADNDTLSEPGAEHDPVVRKKRTFGDIVFRGLADVLGYNVARRPPQVEFPPPLAPVPGIDAPLQAVGPRAPPQLDAPLQIPFAIVPVLAAPQAAPPAPAPCGRAVAPQPCATPAPPPKPKAAPPPCPKPRAAPKPKPKPRPKPPPKPQPPPCGSGRANPTTAAPCGPAPPKADSNLETISSNFRLDFNFNRNPANAAPLAAEAAPEQSAAQQEEPQQQEAPAAPVVAILPQAARLPPEPPRNPRVYLDAYVVQNGVTQKIQTIDAKKVDQHEPDNDYLVYDEPPEPPRQEQQQQQGPVPAQDDDYDYVQDSSERSKTMREFDTAVDQFWNHKKKKKKKVPAYNDYRSVHFGDRDLANQSRDRSDQSDQSDQNYETHEALTQGPASDAQSQPRPALEEEEEVTTTTQNPRRRLKPRVLPPSEKNPNLIDTITVRVPPIYKEKRPRKLHRERPQQTESPERSEHEEETVYKPYDYTYPGSDGNGFYTGFSPYSVRSSSQYHHASDAESENSEPTYQTEQPKRKRRRKNKRKIRSVYKQHYTAGDFDYYGKQLPISDEEKYFRGLTIPPPTVDADLARLEQAQDGGGHFLDDHERIREDPERIKTKSKGSGKKHSDDKDDKDDKDGADESGRSDEAERSSEAERADDSERAGDAERSGEKERADETERSDRLGPNARVRETGYKNNYVHAHNVQVADSQPLVRSVRRKKPKQA